jgi:hypothetical protein
MRDLGASDAVVKNARKASLGAPPPVQVPERGPDPIKSRRRRPYSPARRVGRPSGYRPELVEFVYRLSLLGLTDQELAGVLDISHETLACWKLSYPEFRESITRGKIEADARVAEALYHRACGCASNPGSPGIRNRRPTIPIRQLPNHAGGRQNRWLHPRN